jgi:hypothetical protein
VRRIVADVITLLADLQPLTLVSATPTSGAPRLVYDPTDARRGRSEPLTR